MSTPTPNKLPSWFGQIVLAIALAACGFVLVSEHNRINELEHRQNALDGEQRASRAQLDTMMKSVDKIDDKLDKGFASMEKTLVELREQMAAVTVREQLATATGRPR